MFLKTYTFRLQVDWQYFLQQPQLLHYCKENDIVLQVNCNFEECTSQNVALLEHPVIKKIADKLEVTSTQVVLVWAMQQDVAVIPKFTNPEQFKENITLNFRIPEGDRKLIDALMATYT